MASGTAKIIGFDCPTCSALNPLKCRRCGAVYKLGPVHAPGEKWTRRRIHFGERQWEALVARAKATPGVSGPSEFLRLAIERFLSRPPHRLRRPSMTTEGASAVTAQTSIRQRRPERRL